MAVKTANSASVVAPARTVPTASTGSVVAKDGTTLGYRQYGRGPGLIILHGTMSSGLHHRQLAEALADQFTVYVPDRRGRGLSGSFPQAYSPQTEVDDLEALLNQTGAQNVFGVSAGAIVTLNSALALPAIQKAALFEPPIMADPAKPAADLARFDREIAQGNVAAAMITAMKGAELGPAFFNRMPRWLMERMTTLMMNSDSKNPGDYVPMRDLASLTHYDIELVVAASGRVDRFRPVQTDTLLLGGSKSPAYLKQTLRDLERELPHAQRVEIAGLDHSATWNTDKGGNPEPVAQELRRFFA